MGGTQRVVCIVVPSETVPKPTFYPAPGHRAGNFGAVWYAGRSGYSWSSTIPTGSTDASHLSFSYGGIGPNNSSHRTYGFPLRCLQE